jgi:uncharacterized RDD family membrane protein YckC
VNASPLFEHDVYEPNEAPEGYVSRQSKSWYVLFVGVLSGVIFFAQHIVPFIASILMLPGGMFPGDMSVPSVDRGVYWNGWLWYCDESFDDSFITKTTLRRWQLDGDEASLPETAARVSMEGPWLLPDGDRLWIISGSAVGYLDKHDPSSDVTIIRPVRRPTVISRPFLYEGYPAVIEEGALDAVLLTLENGEWNERGVVDFSDGSDDANDMDADDDAETADDADRSDPADWPDDADVFDELDGSIADFDFDADMVQVVSVGERSWVFAVRNYTTLCVREGLPLRRSVADEEADVSEDGEAETSAAETDDAWQTVADDVYLDWQVVVLDGEPVVFMLTSDDEDDDRTVLVGLKQQHGQWIEFFKEPSGATYEFGVCPLDESGEFAILLQGFPFSVRVLHVRNGAVVDRRKLGGEFPFSGFPSTFVWLQVGSVFFGVACTLMLVLLTSWQMSRHRVAEYTTALMSVPYASLWRRSAARTIDSLISSAPLLVGSFWFIRLFAEGDFDWDTIFSDPEAIARNMLVVAVWLMGAFLWMLLMLVVFSFLEGSSGKTVGKWLLGIEVVGTDLNRCGFLRALGRNLLIIADSFFNWMVGIVLIAFTPNWQRVGDLAAKTIVIRTQRGTVREEENVEFV